MLILAEERGQPERRHAQERPDKVGDNPDKPLDNPLDNPASVWLAGCCVI